MRRVKGDALFALALFLIFGFGLYRALVMNDPKGGPADVGAAFFPFWVCFLIMLLSAMVFVQSVLSGGTVSTAEKAASEDVPMRRKLLLMGGILALLFGYILIMTTLGFVISSAVFLIAVNQLLVFTDKGRISPPRDLAISVVFFSAMSGILFYLFNTVFKLALP